MAETKKPKPSAARSAGSFKERYAAGKALRETCPRDAHATWKPPAGRPDPIQTLLEAEKGRVSDLLPMRHGRMVRSPFTFYRGSALTMATDLVSAPVTAVRAQICGDAHLCNFGGFATPERRVIFSINDLDETLPAPWEWDVKRLAADDLVAGIKDPVFRRRALKRLQKERARSVAEDIFPKLVEHKGEMPCLMAGEGDPLFLRIMEARASSPTTASVSSTATG